MPPRKNSRHSFVQAFRDDGSALVLTDPEPFRFQAFDDNRIHVVEEGDTLWTLAGRFFKGFPRPAGLWWVIADFQPEPIHDPTIRLRPGTVLVIPSVRTVEENVFARTRRNE